MFVVHKLNTPINLLVRKIQLKVESYEDIIIIQFTNKNYLKNMWDLPNVDFEKIFLRRVHHLSPLNKSILISKVTTIPMLISNSPIAI